MMMTAAEVVKHVRALSLGERLKLIELVVHDLAAHTPARRPAPLSASSDEPELITGSPWPCEISWTRRVSK
jgi:hypothetical protein